MFTIRASNEIDEYRQCLQFQFHYYATLLTYAKIKYTKMLRNNEIEIVDTAGIHQFHYLLEW